MGKGWSLRPGSCSQKRQEEVCSSGHITEKLTDTVSTFSSEAKAPFLASSPSKGGQAGTPHLQGARLPGRWSMPAHTQGIRREGRVVQRRPSRQKSPECLP